MRLLKNTLVFSAISLIFITTSSYAQFVKSISVNGGVSIANQDWRYKTESLAPLETKNRPGLYAAVAVEFLKSKNFNIVTEIGFIEKGNLQEVKITTIDHPEGVGEKIYDTKFNYAVFSPLFKAQYEKDHVAIFGLLGFRMDYLLSYKSDFDLSLLENDFNKTIFGLTGGAGIEVKVKQIGIKLESQYHHDLDYALHANMEVNNNALVFSLGAKYYFKSIE